MLKYLFSITIILAFWPLNAQSPQIVWQKCLGGSYHDRSQSINNTADGGYIMAGHTQSNDGDVSGNNGWHDMWVVKLSSTGNIEWQKCLGGTEADEANSIIQTIDGGYIVAGWTMSNDGDVTGNHSTEGDMWVVKLSNSGDIEWQKCLGGSESEIAYSIIQTIDGGYIIAGRAESNDGDVFGNHGSDSWIVKISSSGIIEWQKCLGGSNDDVAHSIKQTSEGGYIVASHSYSNDGDVFGNHGAYDIWIVKLSDTGNIEWQKCLGGTSEEYVSSISQTLDGGYILAGGTFSNNGDVSGNHGGLDFWVVKLSNVGLIEWQKCYGGSDFERAESIIQTIDGGFIVGGYTFSHDGDIGFLYGAVDFWIIKLNNQGAIEWQKTLGGSDEDRLTSILQTIEGGYIASGYVRSNNYNVSGNHGGYDFWIVELTATLNVPELSKKIVTLYPNPAKTTLNLKINSDFLFDPFTISNINGKNILRSNFNNLNTVINVTSLSAGIYFIESTNMKPIKFIKE